MAIKAILFGSIGTIVETSNIQRNCFNSAFKNSGLKWYWSKKLYPKKSSFFKLETFSINFLASI